MNLKESKKRNITIRVTEKQYEEYNSIAASKGLTKSAWGNVLLSTHKHNFNSAELSFESAELIDAMMLLLTQLLEKLEIWKVGDSPRSIPLFIIQVKLAVEILNMTNFISNCEIDELIMNYRSLYHRQLI